MPEMELNLTLDEMVAARLDLELERRRTAGEEAVPDRVVVDLLLRSKAEGHPRGGWAYWWVRRHRQSRSRKWTPSEVISMLILRYLPAPPNERG